jgi:pantetheine-phosphate adenylyltransferase
MTRAVCTGSFDPVTAGHVDIFERAAKMFDELIVCVFHNVAKKPFFTVEERLAFLEDATKHLKNVRVSSFSGLITTYMNEIDAHVIVRGVRSVKDLEYEQNEAYMIRHFRLDIDTVFLLTRPEYSFVSSSGVREIIRFGGRLDGLVPDSVIKAVEAKGL